jgi:hypothetical protein
VVEQRRIPISVVAVDEDAANGVFVRGAHRESFWRLLLHYHHSPLVHYCL